MGAQRTPGTTGSTPEQRSRSAPVIERAPLPIVEVRGDAHIVSYVNSAFCSLLGKTRAQLIGHPFAQLIPGGHECVPLLDTVYYTGEAVTHVQQEGAESDPAYWLYAMWPTLDPDERPTGVIVQLTKAQAFSQSGLAIAEALLLAGLHQHELTEVAEKLNVQLRREVAERKVAEAALREARDRLADQAGELERLVAERTGKLRETLGELEAFSYSVAHNMRAPLRGMQGFARLLLDEHAGQLNPKAHSYLERIASSAVRMDTLIRDVLDYTQVLRGDARLTPVNLDRLVRDLMATYPDWQPPMSDVRLEGTLPFVLGHEGFLTQCVSNLVDNAIKFVATGVTPRVRIWAEDRTHASDAVRVPSDGEESAAGGNSGAPTVRVWFSDNGIGIAPEDHDRIFRMFEHINPANELEGTGIGLTIARKAVERMGGRIDFESEPGAGSKFWIELKKAPRTL
jgi:signal transduction histidine kinase